MSVLESHTAVPAARPWAVALNVPVAVVTEAAERVTSVPVKPSIRTAGWVLLLSSKDGETFHALQRSSSLGRPLASFTLNRRATPWAAGGGKPSLVGSLSPSLGHHVGRKVGTMG